MRRVLLILILAVCAQKAPPPAPDFYPPELNRITVRDQHHLILRFSESVDSTSLDSLAIEDLNIIAGHVLGSDIYLLTEKMEKRDYPFTIVVYDIARNRRLIKGKFQGSEREDTIPPEISTTEPLPFQTDLPHHLSGRIRFTEELDTTFTPSIFFCPGTTDLHLRWRKDLVHLEFSKRDTLREGEIYYLLILGKIKDIAGNENMIARAFPFTTDTILEPVEKRGRVEPAGTAVVFGSSDKIEGITINYPKTGFHLYLKETTGVKLTSFTLEPPRLGIAELSDSVIFLNPIDTIVIERLLR